MYGLEVLQFLRRAQSNVAKQATSFLFDGDKQLHRCFLYAAGRCVVNLYKNFV